MKETENKVKDSIFEKLFKLRENNTSVKTEVLAGITTFHNNGIYYICKSKHS